MSNLLEQTRHKLLSLEQALEKQLPNIKNQLKEIHTLLKEQEDIVTLLTPEEVSIIVAGLKQITDTQITSSTTARKKALKATTVDDI